MTRALVTGASGFIGPPAAAPDRARRPPPTFDSDALDKLAGAARYSAARIGSELGYRPVTTLEEALPARIEDYRRSRR